MVGPDHGLPKGLTILHDFLEVGRHFPPEWLRFEVHDGEIPGDKSHGGQALISSGLALWGENIFMGPHDSMDGRGVN